MKLYSIKLYEIFVIQLEKRLIIQLKWTIRIVFRISYEIYTINKLQFKYYHHYYYISELWMRVINKVQKGLIVLMLVEGIAF